MPFTGLLKRRKQYASEWLGDNPKTLTGGCRRDTESQSWGRATVVTDSRFVMFADDISIFIRCLKALSSSSEIVLCSTLYA